MRKILLITVSNKNQDWLPYPVACIISHCQADPYIQASYEFMEPEYRSRCLDRRDFREALRTADMIGLTCYIWNQQTNDKIAKIYKTYRPDGLVVYGGPNIPEDADLAQAYAAARPQVDLCFVGPGEKNFKSFLIKFDELALDQHEGAFGSGWNNVTVDKRLYALKETPMPYLDGIFDGILARSHNLVASIETNRGCPYHCSFCDWGSLTRSKIDLFDQDVTDRSVDLILQNPSISRLEIVDANFGMYARDLDLIKRLCTLRHQYQRSDMALTFAGMAKNGSRHLAEIMRLALKNFPDSFKNIKLSFQTHTQSVLEVIDRNNIKNERLYPLLAEMKAAGCDVSSELIIGLPGETPDTWLDTLCKHMELGIDFARAYPLYVLPNTPLYSKAHREKHGLRTKTLLLPHDLQNTNLRDYHSNRHRLFDVTTACDFSDGDQYETIEMLYECFSFGQAELTRIYLYWFWYNMLYNSKVAKSAMLASNMSAQDQAQRFFELVDAGQMPFFEPLVREIEFGIEQTVSRPESETQVTTLYAANFITKFLGRGRELVEIYLNPEAALRDLRQIYPDLSFDHFDRLADKQIPRLYTSFAVIQGLEF